MTKAYEQKILVNILYDTRRIFKDDKSITENYYDCWVYLNNIIDNVSDNASEWLLNELYNQRDYYQNKYLINKGLI